MEEFNKFIKIAFIIDVMRKGGGAQKILLIILQILARNGIQAKLIVLKKTQNLIDLTDLDVEFILNDEACKLSENAFLIVDRIVKSTRECDLLVSFMDFITSYFVALSAKMLGKPYDIFVRCEPSFVADTFPQTEVNRLLYKMCFEGARKIVCNSKSSCEDVISNFKIPKDKVFLLYNPIGFEKHQVSILDDYFREIVETRQEGEIFCFAVGRLNAQKNYKILLEAFSLIQKKELPIKLFVLGEGEQRQELEQFIEKNNLNNVFLLGYKENVNDYLKYADIVVHAALFEGFPNVVLEVASLKKTLVLSDIKPHKEIFNENNAMFFRTDNALELLDCLISVFDVSKREILAKRAFNAVSQFSKENFERKLLNVLVKG